MRNSLIPSLLAVVILTAACSSSGSKEAATLRTTSATSHASTSTRATDPAVSSSPVPATGSSATGKVAAPGGSTAPAAGAPTTPAAPATDLTVVRPVTAAGLPAAHFVITPENDGSVTCDGRPAVASRVAVDPGIAECAPSAEYAVACWKASTPGRVLCLRSAWSATLVSIPSSGPFPVVTNSTHPSPLGLVLDDGERCSIRNGGAWAAPTAHPTWVGYYACGASKDTFGPLGQVATNGIDVSQAGWTVQLGAPDGTGPLTVHHVTHAYLVGTAPT